MTFFMHTFDTHKYIKQFQKSGFNEGQAEAIVNVLLESRDFDLSNLATKQQVDILRNEFKTEIKSIENELRMEIKSVEVGILKWVLPLLLTIIGMVATVMVKSFLH